MLKNNKILYTPQNNMFINNKQLQSLSKNILSRPT